MESVSSGLSVGTDTNVLLFSVAASCLLRRIFAQSKKETALLFPGLSPNFCLYLFVRTFTLVTDHHALCHQALQAVLVVGLFAFMNTRFL